MRLYLKLTVFFFAFLVLSWMSGETGRDQVYEAGFALRCYVAAVSHDAVMEDQLVRECQERLRAQMARCEAPSMPSPASTTRPTTTRALAD
jgi:hypothetical protein